MDSEISPTATGFNSAICGERPEWRPRKEVGQVLWERGEDDLGWGGVLGGVY